MSYDLKIYTVEKQSYEDLKGNFNIAFENEVWIIRKKNSQIVISKEMLIEDEDIPAHISRQLPGIQYLIECNLEPYTENKTVIAELLKVAKQVAKNGYGLIENPQTDEIILPSGTKRLQEYEKEERFSTVELSWWFNENCISNSENLENFIKELERTIPEVLPRRYGLYEPPQEKFTTLNEFVKYLEQNIHEGIVWYPSKPVINVQLSIPPKIGPTMTGYRFGYFTISIDSAVLSMPGWDKSIHRLFKNISQIIHPFYGDIFIIRNYIRSRNGAWVDGYTEHHPITSWWWNGLPVETGLGLVVGDPLLDYIIIKRDYIGLDNGCKLIFKKDEKDTIYQGLKIPKGLFQPKEKEKAGAKTYGFSDLYPNIWPFEGPKLKSGY